MSIARSASGSQDEESGGRALLGDIELGTLGQTEQPSQGDAHGDLELDGPLSAFFSKGVIVNVFMLLSVIGWKMGQHYFSNKDVSILSWYSGISVACIVVCFLLHLAGDCIQEVSVRCNLAYLSVFLRIVAATFFLLFLDPVHHRVAILPLAVVLGLLAYLWLDNQQVPAGKYWAAHEADLKVRFDLSSQVVGFGFAGMLGTVLGYVKGSSDQLSGRGLVSPDCFLSYSFVLGLLVQLFSTVPTFILHEGTRNRMAKVYLRIVSYASLMFLVLGGVVAAEEILRDWVFISCFVIVFIPVLCFWYEKKYGPWLFVEERTTSVREENDEKASQIILGCLTSLFTALMASNSMYSIKRGGTAVSLSGWFKCSVLLELYGVLSYAVGMVAFSEMPEMKSLAFPKKVWKSSGIATTIMTIVLVAVAGCLHPDEIKKYFLRAIQPCRWPNSVIRHGHGFCFCTALFGHISALD